MITISRDEAINQLIDSEEFSESEVIKLDNDALEGLYNLVFQANDYEGFRIEKDGE
jgi:hypothetical protein